MNSQSIFKIGMCIALLFAAAAAEKGKGPLSGDYSLAQSRPEKVWWKESHRSMRYEDSPWVWIEYSSNQQRKKKIEAEERNSLPQNQTQIQNEPSYYTIPVPTRTDEVERMRRFRMQKLQENVDVQRL